MTDLRTAALRALEALENGRRVRACEGGTKYQPPLEEAAITALREALAQPEDKSQAAFEHWVDTVEATQEQSIIQPEIKDDKPFGYFRAEPFGWTDCAPTDEGAIPLYTKVDSQGIAKHIPPEAQTEAERVAYCAGWWAALEAKREQNLQGKLLPWKGLTEEEHNYYKALGFVGVKAVEEKLRAKNSTLVSK
jgi:hypothetical protein